jgi:hypothetical protein
VGVLQHSIGFESFLNWRGVVGLWICRREKKISDMEIEKFWQKQQRDRVKRDHEEKTFLTSQNEKATPPLFFFFFQV